MRVVLCEKGHIAGEQSGRNWGWVRQQNRALYELPLAMHSLSRWEALSKEVGRDVGFRRSGIVYTTDSQESLEKWETWGRQAREQGFVETLYGRRLYLPEINARNKMRAQAAERTAINAPMQGTAADIIKRAMLAVDGWLTESDADARMIMQVHDELVFEVAADSVDSISTSVCDLMSGAASLAIPLVVEAGVGDNWDEAH